MDYYCELERIPLEYYLDFSYAPELLYYAYIPIVFISFFIGLFVLVKDNYSLRSKILFGATTLFSIFILNEILLWVSVPASIVHFGWSLSLLLHLLLVVLFSYFTFVHINQNLKNFTFTLFIFIASLPILLLLPSTFNVSAFDMDLCEGVSGYLWYYLYFIEVIFILFYIIWGIRTFTAYRVNRNPQLLQSLYLIVGTIFFLVLIFSSEFVGELWGIYEINLIGPIGMLGFIIALAYIIVKFKAFNIELLATQALVLGLIILIGSQFFFVESATNEILIGVTLVMACIGGFFLVKSVKREVKLRTQIEGLVVDLNKANERLKVLDKMKSEFVSIASHQLRSPLTAIRGYASMIVDGSYGKVPQKMLEVLEKIVDSSKFMALSIEDYLNVSRIEAGNMKYEISDFNLKEAAEKVVDELRPTAMKKGLVIVFRSDCDAGCMVKADIGKTRQILMNLIDNSMKYTPKGTITVVAHDDPKKKKMYITIQDTGIGMSKETQGEVFDKFVRAKNANSVNVTGTGLGLYVAKKMITDMKGRVWAESEGEGKGSTFSIELPLAA